MARTTKAALEAETAVPETDDNPEQPDGILLVRYKNEGGDVNWTVAQLLGNVELDQVQTGLELALKAYREAAGLHTKG